MRRTRALVLTLLLSSPAVFSETVHIKMSDGTALATDIYRPDAEGKYPSLLLRTPYGREGGKETYEWFAQRGYVVVAQDVRGKHDSDGEYSLFRHEAQDGFDAIEWVGAQSWSNGKVGTMGASYGGYTQIAPAVRNNRYLAAISTVVSTSDVFNGWVYTDGALFLGFAVPWGAIGMRSRTYEDATEIFRSPAVHRHLPLGTIDVAAGREQQAFRELLRHPHASDPFWNGISFENRIGAIEAPFQVVTGWYDLFLRGSLQDYSRLAGTHKRLIVGPWAHDVGVRKNTERGIDFGPEAQVDIREINLRWYDRWLKGSANGVDKEPPVRIFVMGENRWRDENEWPLARTRYTKFFLGSDGTLSSKADAKGSSDRFTYDPASPVPTVTDDGCCEVVPFGPLDQAKGEARDDVLVYTSAPLERPLEVTGPIVVKLFASTTARDTDWTAKLVDVHPSGYAQNLQEGIIRARYRNGTTSPASLLEPNQVYEYTIDLWATSNVFLPGHRVRLEISSSSFPRFDRNLNTGEDPFTGSRMERAQQTVHRSARYPSHVILPVIPGPASPAR